MDVRTPLGAVLWLSCFKAWVWLIARVVQQPYGRDVAPIETYEVWVRTISMYRPIRETLRAFERALMSHWTRIEASENAMIWEDDGI